MISDRVFQARHALTSFVFTVAMAGACALAVTLGANSLPVLPSSVFDRGHAFWSRRLDVGRGRDRSRISAHGARCSGRDQWDREFWTGRSGVSAERPSQGFECRARVCHFVWVVRARNHFSERGDPPSESGAEPALKFLSSIRERWRRFS